MSGPRPLRFLARLLLPASEREFIVGDLEELYARRAEERGIAFASVCYLRDVLASAISRRRIGLAPGPGGVRPGRGLGAALKDVFSDVRHALRSLRRQWVFTLIAALTLGVGVGSAGAVFGIVNQILRPVPGVLDRNGTAVLEFRTRDQGYMGVSGPLVEELRESADLLDGFASYDYIPILASTDGARPIETRGYTVYGDYFELLRVRPALGRMLAAYETGPGSDPYVAVISEALWASLFNRAPDVVGRQFDANGVILTVLGVAGDGFRGTQRYVEVDVWVPRPAYAPLAQYPAERVWSPQSRLLQDHVVRLKSGVTLGAAEDQVNGILRGIAAANPDSYLTDTRVTLSRGLTSPIFVEWMYPTLGVLGLIVLVVLLIPCANVGNLLLVRSAYRRGDIAVRRAMGASAGRIAREQVVESLMLGALGAATGLVIARVIGMSYRGQRFLGLPELEGFALDRSALVFASVAVLVTTLLFGVVPALLAGRFDLSANLRAGATQATGRYGRLRYGMSTVQIALSLPLLVGGILLARTLQNIYALDLGLNPDGVYLSTLNVGRIRPDDATLDVIHRRLFEEVRNVPGVEATAIAAVGAYAGTRYQGRVQLPDRPDADPVIAERRAVGPGWFELLEMDIVAGRSFGVTDWSFSGPLRVIFTAPLARRVFGRVDVVGRTVRVGGLRELEEAEIVGVVGDVRVSDPRAATPDEIFFYAFPPRGLRSVITVLVRISLPDQRVLDAVRVSVESVVPDLPVPQLTPLTDRIDVQLAEQRVLARLLGLLSILAILVAAVGLYGVVAFAVANRKREFGIRLALGSDGKHIVALALRSAGSIVVSGTVVGLMGAYGLSRVIESRLVGVEPFDVTSYLTAISLLAVVSVVACWVPAATAARVDPVAALRPE